MCKNSKQNAHEHTGSAEAVRPSLRNGFTTYFVLSPARPCLFVTVIPKKRELLKNLTPAKGRQDHTTSPSASCAVRQRRRRVHRIPCPTSVTIAKRPSRLGRDAKRSRSDLGVLKTKIFFQRGLDSPFTDLPVGQITQGIVRTAVRSASARIAMRLSEGRDDKDYSWM